MIDRALKEELKTLSKEVFGASSKYQKILEHGVPETLTEEVTEYVPGETEEDEGSTRKIQIPVKHKGMNVTVVKRYTPEALKDKLLEMKAQRDAFMVQIKKMQEEAKDKKAAEENEKRVSEELMGSAL